MNKRNINNNILDQYGRIFDYARISVNEKCNLRCLYCMPEDGINFLPNDKLLNLKEFKFIIKVLSESGIKKIRFTGGEPLLNKDIFSLIDYSFKTGVKSVYLTTNGLLLNQKAKQLKESGLTGINISLDTLDHQKFIQITRREGLDKVLQGLNHSISLGFSSIKLNVVLLKTFNQNEINDFIELTKDNNITVRFIELMPFDSHQIWKTGNFIGIDLIEKLIKSNYSNLEIATGSKTEHKIYQIAGYKGKVGIIPAFSRTLCDKCNRIRITADGKLRNCLYSNNEFDLKKLINNGITHENLALEIKKVMFTKEKDGWIAQNNGKKIRESMTQIGG